MALMARGFRRAFNRLIVARMCGRFFRHGVSWEQYRDWLNIIEPEDDPGIPARYNIAPTSPVPALRAGENGRVLSAMRWDLVPFWWNKPLKEKKFSSFNARAEGLATSNAFREPFAKRRCLIPAHGFYEWVGPKGAKTPYAITVDDQRGFCFAGLWDHAAVDGEEIISCSLITTSPNELIKPLHTRMPVILDEADYERWLDPAVRAPEDLLKAFSADRMAAWPVSKAVNNSRAEGVELTAPVPD